MDIASYQTERKFVDKRIVYLAGPVEIEDTWREKAADALEKLDFKVLNPLRGEEFKRVGKHIRSSMSDKAIVQRDINDLERVKLSGGFILMNLNSTLEGRNPIGTLFELMWSYLNHVPVVAVMGRECQPVYKNHSWIKEMVMHQATSITDAINFIEIQLIQ